MEPTPASPWLLPIIVSFFLTAAASVIGWLIKNAINALTEKIEELQRRETEVSERVRQIEVNLPREYVPRSALDALTAAIERVRETFVEEIRLLSAKLDQKADKPRRG